MSQAVDQAVYDRIFLSAQALITAAGQNPEDPLSRPIALLLFALLNAWEKEPEHSDQFGSLVSAADDFSVYYLAMLLEVIA